MRRSKRKSRQTVESSDDDGDGHPATKRHLDLQADDKVCITCHCSSVTACTTWYVASCCANGRLRHVVLAAEDMSELLAMKLENVHALAEVSENAQTLSGLHALAV